MTIKDLKDIPSSYERIKELLERFEKEKAERDKIKKTPIKVKDTYAIDMDAKITEVQKKERVIKGKGKAEIARMRWLEWQEMTVPFGPIRVGRKFKHLNDIYMKLNKHFNPENKTYINSVKLGRDGMKKRSFHFFEDDFLVIEEDMNDKNFLPK